MHPVSVILSVAEAVAQDRLLPGPHAHPDELHGVGGRVPDQELRSDGRDLNDDFVDDSVGAVDVLDGAGVVALVVFIHAMNAQGPVGKDLHSKRESENPNLFHFLLLVFCAFPASDQPSKDFILWKDVSQRETDNFNGNL